MPWTNSIRSGLEDHWLDPNTSSIREPILQPLTKKIIYLTNYDNKQRWITTTSSVGIERWGLLQGLKEHVIVQMPNTFQCSIKVKSRRILTQKSIKLLFSSKTQNRKTQSVLFTSISFGEYHLWWVFHRHHFYLLLIIPFLKILYSTGTTDRSRTPVIRNFNEGSPTQTNYSSIV